MSRLRIPAALLWLVMLISIAPASAFAEGSIVKTQSMNVMMTFDGKSLQPPAGQYVFIYNNTTYVPLRFVSYAIQKSVSWDAKNLKVTVAEPSGSELVVIREYLMNNTGTNTAAGTKNITLNKVNASYVFSGNAKTLPKGLSSYMLNGSLYVPLRFLSEATGASLTWDQKAKAITSVSAGYANSGSSDGGIGNGSATPAPAATAKPTASPTPSAPASGGGAAGGGGSGSGKVPYEQITGETEAKLSALQSQAQSAMMSLVVEYASAKDDAAKKSAISKGKQQLSSFTASFNSIVADAEARLKANGYDTAIISQYRAEFNSQIEKGLALAEGMAG